jgi:hypothetical protein
MPHIPDHVDDLRFGCKILLHRKDHRTSSPEVAFFYTGLRWELRLKYSWFFRYRAALLQVQNPKRYVEVNYFQYKHEGAEEARLRRLKNKLRAAKSKHTQWNKKLNLYLRHSMSMWPESDPMFQKAEKRVQEKKELIECLEDEIKSIEKCM